MAAPTNQYFAKVWIGRSNDNIVFFGVCREKTNTETAMIFFVARFTKKPCAPASLKHSNTKSFGRNAGLGNETFPFAGN